MHIREIIDTFSDFTTNLNVDIISGTVSQDPKHKRFKRMVFMRTKPTCQFSAFHNANSRSCFRSLFAKAFQILYAYNRP